MAPLFPHVYVFSPNLYQNVADLSPVVLLQWNTSVMVFMALIRYSCFPSIVEEAFSDEAR